MSNIGTQLILGKKYLHWGLKNQKIDILVKDLYPGGRLKKLRRVAERIGLAFSQLRVGYLGWLYFIHLKVRYLHDTTYQKVPVYKKWTDKPYSRAVHKTVIASFIISFALLTGAQSFFPYLFNIGKPRDVQSAAPTKKWDLNADFNDNNSTLNQLDVANNSVTLKPLTSNATDCDVTIEAGNTVNIKSLYENASVTGVTIANCSNESRNGSNKGLNYGTGASVNYSPPDRVPVFNSLTINGTLTTNALLQLEFKVVGTLTIPAGGKIDVSEKGYSAGGSPSGTNGHGGYNSWGGGGGAFIGAGGYRADIGNPGSAYTYSYPDRIFGSGGGSSAFATAKSGGGSVRIFANNLSFAGSILANGGGNAGNLAGGGAGGSIYLAASNISTNTGTMEAKGGDIGSSNTGGGGGGYISTTFNVQNKNVSGATGFGNTCEDQEPDINGNPTYYDCSVVAAGTGSATTFSAPTYYTSGSVEYIHSSNNKLGWKSVGWNTNSLPANTSLAFQFQTSDDGSSWSSWSSTYTQNTLNSTSGLADFSQQGNSLAVSKYIKIKVTFNSDGVYTPTLNDFTLTYDTVDSPQNLAVKRSDGTTTIVAGGYTNETTVKVAADAVTCTSCGTSTNPRLQVELTSEAFNNSGSVGTTYIEDGGTGDADASKNNLVTYSGLSVGSGYKVRARGVDNEGRASDWVVLNSGNTSFSIEQTTPTIETVTVKSSTGDTSYVNASTRILTINSIFSDSGGSSTGPDSIKVQFSQDGTNWGAYSGSGTTNTISNTWGAGSFKTVTPSANAQDIANGWYLEGGDGNKTVYVRTMDGAGNVSGYSQNTEAQFAGTLQDSGISKTGGTLQLVGGIVQTGSATFGMGQTYNIPSGNTHLRLEFNGSSGSDGNDGMSIEYYNNGWQQYYFDGCTYGCQGFPTSGWLQGTAARTVDYDSSAWNYDVNVYYGKNGYPASKYYTSQVLGDGADKSYTNLSWGLLESLPTGTSVSIKAQSGTNATPDTDSDSVDGTNWTRWYPVSNSGDSLNSALLGKKYLRYRVTLNSNSPDYNQTPKVDFVSVNYAASDTVILDTSAPNISVGTITAPNGTDNKYYKGGAAKDITWASGNITDTGGSNLTATPISLSYYNGSSWADIAGAQNIANSGSYSWTPPSDNVTNAKIRIKAKDNAGNETTQESTEFIVDSFAPTGSVSALNANYNNKSISISYIASDAHAGVDKVNLYYTRQASAPYTWQQYNGDFDFTSSPGNISFDSTAIGDGHYGFKLLTTDNSGNAMSTPISNTAPDATTFIDTVAPSFNNPSTPTVSVTPNNNGNQTIAWGSFADNPPSSGFSRYEVFRKQGAGSWGKIGDNIIDSQTLSYQDNSALSDGNYYYKIDTYDNAGNMTSSNTSLAHLVDRVAPTAQWDTITFPVADSTVTGGMERLITWAPAKIDDNNGNPNSGLADNPITLQLANDTSIDQNTVWEEIATNLPNSGSYSWRVPNDRPETTTMWIKIFAVDKAGNKDSVGSGNYAITTGPFKIQPDNTAPVFNNPSQSISPLAQVSNVNYTQPSTSLSWNAPDDEGSGVALLELWARKGSDSFAKINANLQPNSTSYTGTFSEGTWDWYLRAVDGVGLLNAPNYTGHEAFSPTYRMVTDGTAPSANLVAESLSMGFSATNSKNIRLYANNIADSLSGFSQIKFSNSGQDGFWTPYGDVTDLSNWDLTDLSTGGTLTRGQRTLHMKLKDRVGNESADITTTIIWDFKTPENPTNITTQLTARSSTYENNAWVGHSDILLGWTTALDNTDVDNPNSSGIFGYEIFRSTTSNDSNPSRVQIITGAGVTSWLDTGLKDGYTYYYWIKSVDNASNQSDYLNQTPSSRQISDQTAPLSPSNFMAVGSDISKIMLSFNSAIDNGAAFNGRAQTYAITRSTALGESEPSDTPPDINNNGNYPVSVININQQVGVDSYSHEDQSVAAKQWYWYRIKATDANGNISPYVAWKARGNNPPEFNQGDISVSVNNNHDSNSVEPGDVVTINFKVTDEDERVDLDEGNASQKLKIVNNSGQEVLAYTQAETKEIYNATFQGYSYTHTYNLPSNADFGTYTISINVKDSVAIGEPGTNTHNLLKTITFKVPAASPRNATATGYSSTQVQLDWDIPSINNSGLKPTDTYAIERKIEGGNFTQVGTTSNTDYRDSGLTPATNYIYRIMANSGTDQNYIPGRYTNELTVTTPTPALPPQNTLELKDASTLSTNSYRILLLWGNPVAENNTTINEVSKYVVQRSETGSEGPWFTLPGEGQDMSTSYFVDASVNAGINYTYRILTKDNFGNLSAGNRQIQGSPGAVPIVTGANAIGRTSSADVTWVVNNQDTTSQVVYSQNRDELMNDLAATSSAGIGGYVTMGQPHTVTLKGLEPGKTYYYRIISRNTLGIPNIYGSSSELPSFNTTNFVINHNTGTQVDTTTGTAKITFDTNGVKSKAFITYGLVGSDGKITDLTVYSDGEFKDNGVHEYTLTGLAAGRTYHYQISAVDTGDFTVYKPANNEPWYPFITKNFDASQFTIAPSASEVAEQNITATSAKIVWNTAIATLGCVEYDTQPLGSREVYPQQSCDSKYNTVHVIELENLTPGLTYYYRVTGTDINKATYFSKEYSFAAILQPEINNLKANVTSPYTTKITFNTNVDTDAVVTYGKDGDLSLKAGQTIMSKEHEIELKDLEDGASYKFFVEVKDRSNSIKKTGENSFSTPIDTAGPNISNVKIELLPMGESDSTASVIISWQTDKPATTKVEYTEGMVGGSYDKSTVEDETLNNSHTVIIKELEPSTTYRFRIDSKNKRGNESKSQDYNFVTPTKEKSIWQLIVKSLEETFSWVKNLGSFFKGQGQRAN